MTLFWPLSRQTVPDLNGRPRLDVRAQFFAAGTTTPLAVYADAARTQPLAQPIACDAAGRFPRVYLPEGLYKEAVSSVSAGDLWTDDGLGTPVPTPYTKDPTPTPDPNATAATGDVKWRLDASVQPGWVRMNGGTIGSTTSGASERGDADTQGLYAYLWQTFPDAIASVVGGRGASAAQDFSAGKVITIPSMQGLVAAGLDTMGNTAAGRLQTIADLTLTAGSSQATVASAARLSPGMVVYAAGVSAGTTITDIAGTTLTLSTAAAAGSSGTVSTRFALFDPQVAGALGGDWLRKVGPKNLPVAMPQGSATVTYPDITYRKTKESNFHFFNGASGGTYSVNKDAEDATIAGGTGPASVAIPNPDGDKPLPTLPPMRLGTYYLKL